MNKIHYSPKSQRDLDEIYDYIKYKLCSPIAAKNTVSGILDKIENLKSHSDIGNIWILKMMQTVGTDMFIIKTMLSFTW